MTSSLNLKKFNFVPNKEIKKILSIENLSLEEIEKIIKSIPNGKGDLVYKNSKFFLEEINSHQSFFVQRFVQIKKLQNREKDKFLEKLARKLKTKPEFLPPLLIKGLDGEGRYLKSLYFPPFVEEYQKQNVVIDGSHRVYKAFLENKSILVLKIKGERKLMIKRPKRISLVKKRILKPAKSKRLFGVTDKQQYRLLKKVGIDA